MHLPDLYCGILLKSGIVETDVDAGTESWVEKTHAISSQEEDTLGTRMLVQRFIVILSLLAAYTVVFKRSQKDRYD